MAEATAKRRESQGHTGMVSIFAILIGALFIAQFESCSDGSLRWTDRSSGLSFKVCNDPRGLMIEPNPTLYVIDGDFEREQRLDDRAEIGLGRLIRLNDWLLVVSDDNVLGGYRFSTQELFAAHDWAKFPLTKWRGEGEVMAERRFSRQGTAP